MKVNEIFDDPRPVDVRRHEKEKAKIESLILAWRIGPHFLNDDLSIHCDRTNVDFTNNRLKALPLIFDVTQDFDCSDNKLVSLHGSPSKARSFDCSDNELTSLKHGPQHVETNYFCRSNKTLKSLQGAPGHVPGCFDCSECKISSLKHSPAVVGDDYKVDNNPIKSLEHIARHIGGDLCIEHTEISSLHNIHKQIDFLGGDLNLTMENIIDSILGVLLIKTSGKEKINIVNIGTHLKDSRSRRAFNILAKHSRDSLIDCQQELIEDGLEEYAQL